MVYFRDRIRQSDESNESDDEQREPDYKKFSKDFFLHPETARKIVFVKMLCEIVKHVEHKKNRF